MSGDSLSFINYTHSYKLPGFPKVIALDGVSISEIKSGEIICIVGPNGSGKSTLLLSILGYIDRSGEEGHVALDNKSIDINDLNFTYIPQKPNEGLVFDLSIIENIALCNLSSKWPSLRRAITNDIRKAITRLLYELGFDFLVSRLDMPPSALSGGQQQILNAISSIYSNSDLIVSDEPTSKLDEINRLRLCKLLIHAAHQNNSRIVMTTHDIEMANSVADRIIHLDQGKVTDEKILRHPYDKRNIPDIRIVNKRSDLQLELQACSNKWWEPGVGDFFDSAYLEGDDSIEGYLASRCLTREERTRREVNAVLRISELSENKKELIADIPCGWGRHSIELAKRGYSVTGIDLSSEYLSIARELSQSDDLQSVIFYKSDMRAIANHESSFDLIINMWTSFGFFGPDDDEKVLLGFHKILKPGGKVILHTDLNPLRVRMGIFDEPTHRRLCSGKTLNVKEWFCSQDSFVYGLWSIEEDGINNPYRIRIYSIEEWEEMASRCGFIVKSIFGSLDEIDSQLKSTSQEFILLLVKQ